MLTCGGYGLQVSTLHGEHVRQPLGQLASHTWLTIVMWSWWWREKDRCGEGRTDR